VLSKINGDEYERRNQVAVKVDSYVRSQGQKWKIAKRQQIGGAGMWKCDPTRLKMSWGKMADGGTRAVMEDCYG
jgi:hypothetical protein